MEIKRTYTTNTISFRRIILKGKISDMFIKSVSVVTVDGEVYQLDVSPFILEDNVVINNPIRNCMAVIVSVDHDYITSEEQLYDCLFIDVSKGGTYSTGIVNTKVSRINIRDFVSVIMKMENKSGVIVSADVGIRCYTSIDTELFNETVTIGLGDGREIITVTDEVKYDTKDVKFFKDGLLSEDNIQVADRKIQGYDSSGLYIYKPEYINTSKRIFVSKNIDIDNNNNIYIKTDNAKYVEVIVRAMILDVDNSSPVIKYIGVMSR